MREENGGLLKNEKNAVFVPLNLRASPSQVGFVSVANTLGKMC
jgi:hypothetical protein